MEPADNAPEHGQRDAARVCLHEAALGVEGALEKGTGIAGLTRQAELETVL